MKILCAASFIALCIVGAVAQTPRAIERELLGQLTKIPQLEEKGDFDELTKVNDRINSRLLKFLKRGDVLRYAFAKLREKMSIATSPDGNFRAYSWDDGSGGSGRTNRTIFQFASSSGRTVVLAAPMAEGDVCSGFYHQIFQTGRTRERVYIANATAVCSGSLSVQSIEVFRIVGERLTEPKLIRTSEGLTNSIRFEYDFFSVVDHKERPIRLVFFDQPTDTFRFPVVIQDEKNPNGRVTARSISYRYNGKQFLKVK